MKYIPILAFFILISSCSVKKRTYRDGYHVDWAFNKKHSEVKSIKPTTSKSNSILEEVLVKELVTSNTNEYLSSSTLSKKENINFLTDTCGDIITFKSGDILKAKVYEISDDKIKYKRCDNIDGPFFSVSKSAIHSIKYTNGVIDIIEPPVYSPTPKSNEAKPINRNVLRTHPKAIWALALLIMGFIPFIFFFPWIISLILAVNGIDEIEAKPDVYKGLRMAKTVRMIDIVLLSLVVLILLITIVIILSVI